MNRRYVKKSDFHPYCKGKPRFKAWQMKKGKMVRNCWTRIEDYDAELERLKLMGWKEIIE